jgi:hypothetical protein
MEDITCQAFRVHPHEDAVVAVFHIAKHERDVLMTVDVIPVANHSPHSELGWQPGFRNAMHETL